MVVLCTGGNARGRRDAAGARAAATSDLRAADRPLPLPLRSAALNAIVSGRAPRTPDTNASYDDAAATSPSSAVMRWPSLTPAFSAGDPGTTLSIAGRPSRPSTSVTPSVSSVKTTSYELARARAGCSSPVVSPVTPQSSALARKNRLSCGRKYSASPLKYSDSSAVSLSKKIPQGCPR